MIKSLPFVPHSKHLSAWVELAFRSPTSSSNRQHLPPGTFSALQFTPFNFKSLLLRVSWNDSMIPLLSWRGRKKKAGGEGIHPIQEKRKTFAPLESDGDSPESAPRGSQSQRGQPPTPPLCFITQSLGDLPRVPPTLAQVGKQKTNKLKRPKSSRIWSLLSMLIFLPSWIALRPGFVHGKQDEAG